MKKALQPFFDWSAEVLILGKIKLTGALIGDGKVFRFISGSDKADRGIFSPIYRGSTP